MNNYSNESWKSIVEKLNSDIYSGLGEEECNKRRSKDGNNVIHFANDYKGVKVFFKSFVKIHFIIDICVLAFAIYLFNTLIIGISSAMLLMNIVLKILDINRKKKNLASLQKLNHTTTTVLRNNNEKVVNCEELVKGDIVIVKKGSLVAADLRLIEAKSIKVNERSLTGETFTKDKFESKMEGRIENISQAKNMLFKGTVVTDGSGIGIVVETGDNTQIGRLMAMITYSHKNKHILEEKIEKKYNLILFLLCLTSIIPFLTSMGTEKVMSNLLLALSLVTTLPVGVMLFSYFKLLKSKLTHKYNIELMNISTLETVNDIEFMFLDKIGSLTQEKMTVEYMYSNNVTYSKNELSYQNDINIKRMIDILLLCNDATYNATDDSGKGQLSEVTYLKLAAKKRVYKSIVDSNYPRIFEIPMDYDKRILTTVNKYKRGFRANVRGNVDVVLDRCKFMMVEGVEKELSDEDRDRIRAIDYNFSVDGLISEGVAYRNFNYQPSASENIESNLVFVGIVALDNPFVEGIENQMSKFISNNINPILFTEDNRIVAVNLGKRANLISDIGGVISGVEMSTLNKEEFKNAVGKTRIFSRVTPNLKSKIIGMYIKDNYKVVASGETLGDLPTLSMAKIGISKGNAPEIVKNTSDIFIKENYLNKFIKMFKVGKKFFNGMNMFIAFIASMIIAQMLIISSFRFVVPDKDILEYVLLFNNIVLAYPLSLIIFNSQKEEHYKGKYVIRTILFSGLSLISMYLLPDICNEAFVLLFGGMLIIHTIICGHISFKRISKDFIFSVISIFIWLMFFAILAVMNSISLSWTSFLYIGGLFIMYLLVELIMKRWQ